MHFYEKCVLRCLLGLHYFLRHLVRLVFPLHSFSYGLYNIHITAVKDVKNELPCVINTKINLLQDEYASLWKVMPAEKVFLSLKGFSRKWKFHVCGLIRWPLYDFINVSLSLATNTYTILKRILLKIHRINLLEYTIYVFLFLTFILQNYSILGSRPNWMEGNQMSSGRPPWPSRWTSLFVKPQTWITLHSFTKVHTTI